MSHLVGTEKRTRGVMIAKSVVNGKIIDTYLGSERDLRVRAAHRERLMGAVESTIKVLEAARTTRIGRERLIDNGAYREAIISQVIERLKASLEQ